MFNISIKIPKSKLESTATKKPSKLSDLFCSMFRPKPKLSVIDLGPSKKSTLPSIEPTKPVSQSSVLLSLGDAMTIIRYSIPNFIQSFERVAWGISVGFGVFGGFYAVYQIFFPNIGQHAKELERLECVTIVY